MISYSYTFGSRCDTSNASDKEGEQRIMSLVDLQYTLIISQDETITKILENLSRRLGAHRIKHCTRQSQALAELEKQPLPELIIEDLKTIDRESLFPTLQENKLKNYLIPVPIYALVSPMSKSDIEIMQNSNYIGYELKPFNETLLEQKIREIFYESYSYDQANALNEVIEQYIAHKNLKSAYLTLLPTLAAKPKNTSYLLLYSTILFERKMYSLAEKVLNFILQQDPDNFKAKNIITKILIATKRYQEGDDLI